MRELSIAKYIGASVEALREKGFEVLATDDFERVISLSKERGRAEQSPMLSVSRLGLTKPSAFWLFILRDGKAVGGLAAKYQDLGSSETFEEYLRRTSRHQYGFEHDPIVSVAEPVRRTMPRRLIYIGELEFLAGHRGRPSLLAQSARLMKGIAALRWPEFEAMYAFIPDHHYRLARAYGFDWQYPNAIKWRDPVPPGRLNSHWIMGSHSHGFDHALAVEMAALNEQKPY